MRLKAVLRLILFSILLCAGWAESLAQRSLQLQVRNNRGAVIPYTGFMLRNADNTLLYTGLTDSTGNFTGNVLPPVAASLRIEVTGFRPEALAISNIDSPVITRNIILQPASKLLSGVTVTSRKPLLERRADRTVFNVEGSVAAIGSDALEVLKHAPGIRVTDDEVSIAGKSTVAVLINDKLVQLSGADLIEMLKSIPADNLSRIEVITTPPAKYDAQGSAGLVNIVLKKNNRNGFNGQATALYNQHFYNGYGGNGTFNYRKDNLNVFGSGNIITGTLRHEGEVNTTYPGVELRQAQDAAYKHLYGRLLVGADYNITPRMIVGAQYTVGRGGWKWATDEGITTRYYSPTSNTPDSSVYTGAQTRDRGFRNVFNLNWEWKPDTTGKKLSADIDYFTRIADASQDFSTTGYGPTGIATGSSDNRNGGTQKIDIRNAKLDVEWPAKTTKLSAGGKLSQTHNTSDNVFRCRNGAEWPEDLSRSNAFDYKEATEALYFSAQRTWGKWEAQAGIRGEYTQTSGYSPTVNQHVSNDYFQLFPTAYVQYHRSENHEFGAAYSRRIGRPEFWLLNPFREYTTPTSYEAGNPYLQPSFANNAELNYTYKSRYTATVFGEKVAHYYARYSVQDTAAGAIIFGQANLGTSYSYGISLSGTIPVAKWWEATIQMRAYNAVFSTSFYGAESGFEQTAFSFDATSNFILNKDRTILAELGGEYNSAQLSDFDIQRPMGALNGGIKAIFFKGKLTAGVSFEDLLRTNVTAFRNLANGTTQRYYADERNLHLSLSWKFGNNGKLAQRERKQDEDSKRLQ